MKIKLTTGFGTMNKSGNVVGRFEFAPGSEHDFPDDIAIVELPSRAAMESVAVYKVPKTAEQLQEFAIAEKSQELIRIQAVDELKKEGKLPADYDPKVIK